MSPLTFCDTKELPWLLSTGEEISRRSANLLTALGAWRWSSRCGRRSVPNGSNEPPARRLAVATSGDTEQFLEIDGVRYSHLIDPRSGQAVTDRKLVTVVAPSGMLADAYASALSVLSLSEGRKLVDASPEIEAIVWQLDRATGYSTLRGAATPVTRSSGVATEPAGAGRSDRTPIESAAGRR